MIHRRTHATPVDGCYACKLATVAFSAVAMPSRRPDVVRIENTEKGWHRDHDAYRLLRKQGYQPARVDGSADLAARAQTVDQIEGRPPGYSDMEWAS